MVYSGHSGQKLDPMGRLKSEAVDLVGALGDKAVSSLRDRVEDTAGRLTDFTANGANGGGAGLMAAVTGAKGLAEGKSPVSALASAGLAGLKEKVTGMFGDGGKSGKGGRGKGLKVTNIVEQIDVGAPVELTYNLWTQFSDFPTFMKKLESVNQEEDEKLNFRAQVFWSHRNWESTILEQTPDEQIIWRSQGAKGYVDGAVTFHALAPRLTRIILVLEYHPQGLFEHTGNLWRAQGRRVRLELKHFRRHLMSQVLLHPDEVEGWRGTIREGQVVDRENGDVDIDVDEQDSDEQDVDEQDSDEQEGATRTRAARSRRSASDSGEDTAPDRGDRRGRDQRTERAERADRPERQRRGSTSSSGSTERARRPAAESRRGVPRQQTRSTVRAGERSGRGTDRKRSAQ